MKNILLSAALTLTTTLSFAGTKGTAEIFYVEEDSTVENITITGDAAKRLHDGLSEKSFELSKDKYSILNLKVAPNMKCFEDIKLAAKGKPQIKKYSCSILVRDGAALSGAAG